jgi:hypothetical protein
MWETLTSHLNVLLEELLDHEDKRVRRVSWVGFIAYLLASITVAMATGAAVLGQVASLVLWLLASCLLLALTIGSLLRAFWLMDPQAGKKVLFLAGVLLLVPAPLLMAFVAVVVAKGFATGRIRLRQRPPG